MFHFYAPDYSKKESYRSADQAAWESWQRNDLARLKSAIKLKDTPDVGIRANALLVLYTCYSGGSFVEVNSDFADKCLKEAAELGHAQACFELVRRLLEQDEKKEALRYVEKALENIDDKSFDSELTSHNQTSMKNTLLGLQKICAMKLPKI